MSEGVGQKFSFQEVLPILDLIYVDEVECSGGVTIVDIGHCTFDILAYGVFGDDVVGVDLGAVFFGSNNSVFEQGRVVN